MEKIDREKKDWSKLTDEQLLAEKKKLNKSRLFFAISIGFLVGILLFGVAAWSLAPDKNLAFIFPLLIPVVFIYRILKSPNKNKDLEEVLKERGLN